MAEIITMETDAAVRSHLSAHQKSVVWNALSIAATRYDEDSKTMLTSSLPPLHRERLSAQFVKQAKEARELMEIFE